MIKKRFLLLLNALVIALVSLVLSSFSVMSSPAYPGTASYLYQRNTSWIGSAQTSKAYHLDGFRREWHLEKSATSKLDASNYFLNLS